jgi:catechol 2,3-dioxygenase-like lactoylglutathione lyase family enzyme
MTATTGIGRLDQVSLYCGDVERSKGFYAGVLGFPHIATYGDLVFFDMSGVRLYLHRVDDGSWRAGSVLYFDVDDIFARTQALADVGVRFKGQPHLIHRDDSTGEETWMAFFEDPDGNLLALSSRVRPG